MPPLCKCQKPMKKIIPIVVIALFLCLCPCTYARKAKLRGIHTVINGDSLFVSFSVTDCFQKKMIQAIKNGINTRFVFLIRLYKVRRWWWDKKIRDLRIVHSIRYDSIKKVYILRFSEMKRKEVVLKDLNEAKRVLSTISQIKVIDKERLKKGVKYQLRIKAELDKIKLPFHLHHVLFFLSLWNFDTDWYKINIQF